MANISKDASISIIDYALSVENINSDDFEAVYHSLCRHLFNYMSSNKLQEFAEYVADEEA